MSDSMLGQAILKLDLQHGGFITNAAQAEASLKKVAMTAAGTALGFGGAMGLISAVRKTTEAFVGNIKEIATYQKGMAEVSTIVDTTKVNMAQLGTQVDKISSKWGKDRGGLAAGLYEAVSANIDAAHATEFLNTAVMASVGGLTDAKVAVDGLTSIINAYGLDASKAEEASDALFVTVRDGKTKYDELSASIGNVVPMAAALGVNIDTLGSSIATVTLSGQSTSEAITGLRTVFTAIIKPTDSAKEAAKLLGIDLSATAVKAKGFAAFMEEVRQKTAGSQLAMGKLFPDVQGLNAALQLTSDQGAKNFNRILDDMTKKTGSTRDAAEKMKDTLSFKWDKAVQDTKLFGQDLTKWLVGPLEAALERYNAIGNSMARLRAGEGAGVGTTKDSVELNPYASSTADIKTVIEQEKERTKELKEYISANEMGAEYEQTQLKNAEALIVKLEEILELRKQESGVNKRLEDEAKYRAQEAQKSADAEKAKAEAARKAKEEEVTRLIKETEEKKKNAEIAEKNAALLNRLEEDRLTVSARIASVQDQNNQLQIEGRKEAAESIRKYDKMVYDSQVEQLEAVAADEGVSVEKRIKANQDLYQLKISNAEAVKNHELTMLKIQSESEIAENDQRIQAIEQFGRELDQSYRENYKKVSESTVANKEQVLKTISDEHLKRKEALDFMLQNNNQTFQQVEQRGKQAATNIDKEFKNALEKEKLVSIKASVELQLQDLFDNESNSIFNGLIKQYKDLKDALGSDKFGDETKKKIEREMSKVQMSIISETSSITKSVISTALSAVTAKTNEEITSVVENIGSIVSDVGEKSSNEYVKFAGETIGILSTLFRFFDQGLDMWGNKARKQQEDLNRLISDTRLGIDATINSTREWLIELGKIDRSNMSYSELVESEKKVYKTGASEINKTLGTTSLSSEDFKNLYDVSQITDRTLDFALNKDFSKSAGFGKSYKEFVSGLSQDQFGNLGSITEQQYNTILKTQQQMDLKGVNYAKVEDQVQSLFQAYKGYVKPIQEDIATYGQSTGIDPSQSTTRDDLLEDLNAMRDLGMISQLEYYKQLYEYSNGLRAGNGNVFTWFSEIERRNYKKQYEDAKNGGKSAPTTGIIGLASGGIAMTPMVANIAEMGAPEAVIPLDRMPEIAAMFNRSGSGVGQIVIENRIDPNIPITQDSARFYSERIGESVSKALRARGN